MKGITRRCKSKDRQFNDQKEKGQKQAMIKLYNVNIDFLSAHDAFLA